MAKADSSAKSLAPGRRLLGWASLFAVTLVGMGVGLLASGALQGGGSTDPEEIPPIAIVVIFGVLSVLTLAAGLGLYGIAIATNCFTLNLTRPFMDGYGAKVWLANLAIGLFIQAGISLLVGAFLVMPLRMFLPERVVFGASFFLPFIALQVFFTWLNIATPFGTRLIARRLMARGISPEQIRSGRMVGTSDPTKSSLKKMTVVEEDMGVMWISGEQILFTGDRHDWALQRDQVVEVERVADPGAMSAYFGAVHVILRYQTPEGEGRIRLHPEGVWTATGKARALNELAEELEAWKRSQSPPLRPVGGG